MEFLDENSLTRGYTTYWISYPLAFLSNEEMVFVPKLPYHDDFRYTSRDDRYPSYDEWVSNAEQVAFITANQPWLDNYLRGQFDQQSIQYHEMKIGDFTVFFRLSRTISPEEIGIADQNINNNKEN